MSDLRDLYQEVILDHYRKPRNFRSLADAYRRSRQAGRSRRRARIPGASEVRDARVAYAARSVGQPERTCFNGVEKECPPSTGYTEPANPKRMSTRSSSASSKHFVASTI